MSVAIVENLKVVFGSGNDRTEAVDGLSFEVQPGEIVGLVGASGSGKSVSCFALPKLLPAKSAIVTSDRMEVCGRDVNKLTPDELRKMRGRQIAIVFQEPMTALNPRKRIGELLREALTLNGGQDDRDLQARALDLLHRVKLPDPGRVVSSYPFQLSGGMRQRVVIALAFAGAPDLLIADEPTTALDVSVQAEILDLIVEMSREQQTGVLFISHDLAVVSNICDRVIVLRDGRAVESGNVGAVLSSPKESYTKALIDCLPERNVPGERLPVIASTRASVKASERERRLTSAGRVIINASDVTRDFPIVRDWRGKAVRHVSALKQVSFSLHEGGSFGIIGDSGSGKTTLSRILVGLDQPTSGRISVYGDDPFKASRCGRMQMVFQDPRSSLNPRLDATALVTEPVHGLAPSERRALAASLFDRTGIPQSALERLPHEFSGGQRQRLAIARALSTDPEIVVLDEPTSALDPLMQAQVLNLLLDLRERFGLTFVLVTHDMAVVRHMTEEVLVLKDGEVVEHGATAQVLRSPRDDYTRRLIAAVPKFKYDAGESPSDTRGLVE